MYADMLKNAELPMNAELPKNADESDLLDAEWVLVCKWMLIWRILLCRWMSMLMDAIADEYRYAECRYADNDYQHVDEYSQADES